MREISYVGPILIANVTAQAVASAIMQLNKETVIIDRGSYLRILTPDRCVVTKAAIEAELGSTFAMRQEMERIMTSFLGKLELTDSEAVWTKANGPRQY